MIQRLITTLQALAAPVEVQLSRFPDFVVKADELALDFNDALVLVRDCRQLELTRDQEHALFALDRTLDAMSGPSRAHLWTEGALRESDEWHVVRALAVAALEVLGAPVGDPGPSGAVYVRGSPPGT